MGHLQGQVVKLQYNKISPLALSSEVAATPLDQVTTAEGGTLGAQHETILQLESPWLSWGSVGFEDGEGSRLGPHSGVRYCPPSPRTPDLIRTYRGPKRVEGGCM